jgi:hypothetical protein
MENFSLNLLIVDHYNNLISEIENTADYLVQTSDRIMSEDEISDMYKIKNRYIEELMHIESSNMNNLYLISSKLNLKLNELKQKNDKIFDDNYLNEIKKELFQNKCCLFIKSHEFNRAIIKSIKNNNAECLTPNGFKLGVVLIFNWFPSNEQIRGLK